MAVRPDIAIINVPKKPYEKYEMFQHWPCLNKGVEKSKVLIP